MAAKQSRTPGAKGRRLRPNRAPGKTSPLPGGGPGADPAPGGKRERTRTALVAAAARLIEDKGYHNITLEDVAKNAGMSRGAIYGNFKDREDLFMAVLESRWQPIIPPFKPGAPLPQQMQILAESVIAAAPGRQAGALRALEFQIYALTHPKMQAKLERYAAEGYRMAEQGLLRFISPQDLHVPPAHFVRVLNALTEGLLFERFQAPREITDEVIRSAFAALAGGSR
jgi:AcrR family transcriptional regulator